MTSAVVQTPPAPADPVRPTPAPRRRRPPRGVRAAGWSVNGFLVLGSLYMVFPIVWLLFASTKNLQDLYSTSALGFGDFSLVDNVLAVLRENGSIFGRWMVNSIFYSVGGAIVGGFICVLAGYAFDKLAFRGKERWYLLVLVGVLVPSTATAIPLYLLASSVGLTNTVWAVLIPFLVNPFGVYLARIFSAGYIEDATLEAARMDGAGELAVFTRVGLPMLTPGYVTIVLFQFVGIWNSFMLPLIMLSDQKLYPVSLGLYGWNSQTTSFPEFYPLVLTGSLLSLVPMLLAFLFLQRFWRAGLTAGSVK